MLAFAGEIPTSMASDALIEEAFGGATGALVVIDTGSGRVLEYGEERARERRAPCSTFKIWNALIGLESGVVEEIGEPFWKWDGRKRFLASWNGDLNFSEAFRESCVPAFQELARRIGEDRMRAGLKMLGYGNEEMGAGLDVFWLPAPGRRTVEISPLEQAELQARLAEGKVPFSQASQQQLQEIMLVEPELDLKGWTLRGKTGSGANEAGEFNLGWFVGYAEKEGRRVAFACLIEGEGKSGRAARRIVETLLPQLADLIGEVSGKSSVVRPADYILCWLQNDRTPRREEGACPL